MKTLTLALMSTTLLLSSAFASESQDKRMYNMTSEIIKMKLDPKQFQKGLFDGGRIELNQHQNKLSLILEQKFECLSDFCMQVMPEPVVITLPITDISVNECGAVFYRAEKDLRPVDGAKEVITVTDNTHNHCPSLVPYNAVDAAYKVYAPQMSSTRKPTISVFVGESFKAIR